MQIPWHDPIRDQKELPVSQAPLPIRAGVVGRVGLLLLSCGTGAWRVRSSMNEIAEALGLVCAADIGLLSIEYTCSDGENTFAQTLTLTATGVNTAKLDQLERFVKRFPLDGVYMTADDLHTRLDEIAQAAAIPRCSRGWPRRSPAADSRSCSAAGRSRCCWPFWARASGSMCARG